MKTTAYWYNLNRFVVFEWYRYEEFLESLFFLWITVFVCAGLCATKQRKFIALYHYLKPKSHDV